jgi:hypothetical protein
MNRIPIHPAPGLGDLMAGYFVVPQDPLQFQNEGISVKPSLGDFIDASFVVPQNPLLAQISGTVAPIGQGSAGMPLNPKTKAKHSHSSGLGCGCGCGGSGSCGGGLGTLSTDWTQFTTDLEAGNIMTALQDTIGGIPSWVYMAGIAALVFVSSSGKKGRR